jgi:hypothetical protein
VISEEVEKAMKIATTKHNVTIREFTVAPNINPKQGLPRHEWYVEFETIPDDIMGFSATLEKEMISQNIYYKDLILGNIIQPLDIVSVSKGGFNTYMKSVGRLGGQNKVPRLSNDRKIADILNNFNV